MSNERLAADPPPTQPPLVIPDEMVTLVEYLQAQKESLGPFTTAHGGLVVAEMEVVEPLLDAIYASGVLKKKSPEPEPVRAEVSLAGSGAFGEVPAAHPVQESKAPKHHK